VAEWLPEIPEQFTGKWACSRCLLWQSSACNWPGTFLGGNDGAMHDTPGWDQLQLIGA
jgi:hypothetical protein